MTFNAGAGSILGLPAVIGDQPYSLTAIAEKSSVVRFVSRGEFDDVVRADLSLYPYVLQVLAAEVRAARSAVTDWKGRPGGR
jgi:CRP-like cAMP-binding protein